MLGASAPLELPYILPLKLLIGAGRLRLDAAH